MAIKIDTSEADSVIEGEMVDVLETGNDESLFEEQTVAARKHFGALSGAAVQKTDSVIWIRYIVVPFVLLLVTLFGGLRLVGADHEFLFLKPALICLIFAAFLIVLFFRARLIRLEGWFSESFSPLHNSANAFVMLTLFSASVQMFNSLLPERGLAFWVVSFFFFWSLWTNLFAEFNVKKLLISLGSLFGLAFLLKYLVLASLTATENGGIISTIFSGNLTKEAFTYLLDLPGYSNGTGYVQFFTVVFYMLGLALFSSGTEQNSPQS